MGRWQWNFLADAIMDHQGCLSEVKRDKGGGNEGRNSSDDPGCQ